MFPYTKRYKLGQLLATLTRNFLLLTATPHNGKEADFQLFMAILDGDPRLNFVIDPGPSGSEGGSYATDGPREAYCLDRQIRFSGGTT